jgi:hypothetical protein
MKARTLAVIAAKTVKRPMVTSGAVLVIVVMLVIYPFIASAVPTLSFSLHTPKNGHKSAIFPSFRRFWPWAYPFRVQNQGSVFQIPCKNAPERAQKVSEANRSMTLKRGFHGHPSGICFSLTQCPTCALVSRRTLIPIYEKHAQDAPRHGGYFWTARRRRQPASP